MGLASVICAMGFVPSAWAQEDGRSVLSVSTVSWPRNCDGTLSEAFFSGIKTQNDSVAENQDIFLKEVKLKFEDWLDNFEHRLKRTLPVSEHDSFYQVLATDIEPSPYANCKRSGFAYSDLKWTLQNLDKNYCTTVSAGDLGTYGARVLCALGSHVLSAVPKNFTSFANGCAKTYAMECAEALQDGAEDCDMDEAALTKQVSQIICGKSL